MKAKILLIKLKQVDGQNWRDSGYCLGVKIGNRVYSDDIFERCVYIAYSCYDITDYVSESMETKYEVYISDEIKIGIESELF